MIRLLAILALAATQALAADDPQKTIDALQAALAQSQQQTAQVLAKRISAHHAVARVFYPGLPGQDPKGLLGRQLGLRPDVLSTQSQGGATCMSLCQSAAEMIDRGMCRVCSL